VHTLGRWWRGVGITLLPRIVVAAGIAAGTGLVLRPLAGAGGWRTLSLVWRPQSPRAAGYRALVPLMARVAGESVG